MPHKLRMLREDLKNEDSKWTQQFIAQQVEVARVTYTSYENGTKTPPTDILLKLAIIFNVSTDYLLGRTDYHQTLEELISPLKDTQKLLDWYVNLPVEPQNSLIKLQQIWEIITEHPKP